MTWGDLKRALARAEQAERERDEALVGSDRMHVRAAEFLSAHYASVAAADAALARAEQAERERDEALARIERVRALCRDVRKFHSKYELGTPKVHVTHVEGALGDENEKA